MSEIYDSIKKLLKYEKKICIDNPVFQLHYKVTMALLITFSLVVVSKQYFGEAIACITSSNKESKENRDAMEAYCWIHSTFNLPQTFIPGAEAYPGVRTPDGDEQKYHKYYQWVSFLLFLQAFFFYVPRYLWKTWEGGRIKMLAMDLDSPMVDIENKNNRKKLILDNFIANVKNQNSYAWRFFMCEVLNFMNVVGQIFLMDIFLGNEFTTYGSRVLAFTEDDPFNRVDPMAKVFPKMTKCVFNQYGPSGQIVPHDLLCLLPVNVINEKIYVFVWFWFIIISVISGLALIYRLVTILVPAIRMQFLGARARLVDFDGQGQDKYFNTLGSHLEIGDWFVLSQLGRNMDPLIFCELIHDLGLRLNGRDVLV